MSLVVLAHVAIWFDENIDPVGADFWLIINEVLGPLRMPLFFLISGYMSVRALTRPLSSTKSRTLGLIWVYTIWTLLFVARLYIPAARGDAAAPSMIEVVLSVILPTPFWYLWALPVYFLLTWLAVRAVKRHAVWLLIPLFALAATAPMLDAAVVPLTRDPMDPLKLGSVAANLVWFYAGAVAPTVWDRAMQAASWPRLVSTLAVYAVLITVALQINVTDAMKALIAPVALFAAAQVLALLNMNNPLWRGFQWVGRRTLPIYVLHLFAISVISAVVTKIPALLTFFTTHGLVLGILSPVLFATVLVITSRMAGTIALRYRATRWLFQAPVWLVDNHRQATPLSVRPATEDLT